MEIGDGPKFRPCRAPLEKYTRGNCSEVSVGQLCWLLGWQGKAAGKVGKMWRGCVQLVLTNKRALGYILTNNIKVSHFPLLCPLSLRVLMLLDFKN